MIFLKDKEIIPFKADHEPIGIYVGDKTIFEPIEVTKSGNDIELNNTYNHKLGLSIQGNSTQKREYLKTVTDNIIQVESERAVVEVKGEQGGSIEVTHCGRNLTTAYDFYKHNSYFSELIEDNRECVRFVDNHGAKGFISYGKDLTLSLEIKGTNKAEDGNEYISYGIFYNVDGTNKAFSTLKNQGWKKRVHTNDRPITSLGTYSLDYRNWIFVDKNTFMLELGDTPHPYEEYKGETLTIPFNTPTVVSMYKGVNTFYADEPISLTYTTEEQTDEQTPTPLFPSEVHSSYEGEGEGVVVNDKLYTIPILRSVGDVRDTFENGVYTQRIKKIRLTSSMEWYIYGNKKVYYTNSVKDCIQGFQSSVCTHFPNINEAWKGDKLSYSDHSVVKNKYFSPFTSKEDFLKFLDDNEVYLYYILETPIITTLPYDLKTKPNFTRVRSVSEVGARVEAKALVYEL